MTSTYNDSGLTIDRYDDIRTRLIALAQSAWGESVNTDDDQFLGHNINNIALLLSEINELVQSIADARSIANASGAALDRLLEIIGLSRVAAAYSTATLKITVTAITTIPAGTQYKTASNIIFATDSEVAVAAADVSSGYVTAASTCTVTGANNAAAGEIDTIVNNVYGVSAVTNDAAATPGRDRETDSEARIKHANATATSGENDASSIYESVMSVTGVSKVYVYDNNTDATASDGTPANSVHVCVVGGDTADVAAAIDNNITASVPTFGIDNNISVYNETTSQTKTVNFDTGDEVPIYISATITTDSTFASDGEEQIKSAIVAFFNDFELNDDVIFTEIYRPFYSVAGHIVTNLKTGTTDPPSGTSNITVDYDEYATITTTHIDLTII